MTGNHGKGSYHRPGARRRNRLRVTKLVVYCMILVLLAGAIWGVSAIVKHNKAERAAQQEALRLEEERIRQEQAAQQMAEAQAQTVAEYAQVFADNIYLDGELLSGRTYDDVLSDFTNRYADRLAQEVTIRFNGAEWKLSGSMAGGSANVQEQVDAAWAYVHTGTDAEKMQELQQLQQEPVYLDITVSYDEAAVTAFAQQLKDAIDSDPVNATFSIIGEGKTETTDSVLGYELDLAATGVQLMQALDEGTQEIDLLPAVIEPEITEEDVGGGYVKLAQFATYFKGSTTNRSFNIKHALGKFDGLVVQPGQRVSFNDVVGPRTGKAGFREAVEYQDGQSVTGIGGGVCQASTTLYGALLRAGLQINERSAHSLPVGYVPPSQDATVSNQGTDLVFTNNTSAPIYIYTSVNKEKSRAMVTIYGTPVKSYVEIEIESEIIQDDIAATPKYIKDTSGQHVWYADEVPVLKKQGKLGYKSCAYRIYRHKETGEILKKELLSTDYYAPVAAEYYIGVH